MIMHKRSSTIAPVSLLLVSLVCGFTAPGPGRAGDQPQWGQRFSRNMVSGEKDLPGSFDPVNGGNIKWRAALGSQTYSTPVVAGGRVLIGTNNEEPRDPRHRGDRGVLMCLMEENGALDWQLVAPKLTGDPYLDWPKEGMVSTATVEGERIYMVSNRGEVLCLDLYGQKNGNDGPFYDEGRYMAPEGENALEVTKLDADILWRFDMPEQIRIHQHDAAHSSILIHGRFLYVNTSNGVDNTHRRIRAPDAPSLIVLDKATGRWIARDDERIGPNIFHSTWSSPSLGRVGERDLVFFGGGDGICYAFLALSALPADRRVRPLELIWRYDGDPSAPKENVHQYVKNRSQSPSNIKSMPVCVDGRIYITLGGDIWWGKRRAWLKCIDASGPAAAVGTGEIWSYELEDHCCSTPSVHRDMVFVADCGKNVHCVNAKDGIPIWTHEIDAPVWASTLVADGKVYLGSRRGVFWIFAASESKRVLSRIELDSSINGTATAANGVLYVATMKTLYALTTGE